MLDAIKFLLTAHDVKLSFRIANVIMRDELRFEINCAKLNLKYIEDSDKIPYIKRKGNKIYRDLSKMMFKSKRRLIKKESTH